MTKIIIFTKEDIEELSNNKILLTNGNNEKTLYMSEERYKQYLEDCKNIITHFEKTISENK